jgi:ribonuclease VapC
MSAFVDASVIVAILSQEDDGPAWADRVAAMSGPLFVSSLVRYEAVVGLAQKKARGDAPPAPDRLAESRVLMDALIAALEAEEIPIAGEVGDRALSAASRFGKVVGHPAGLNFGDCFAYACAQSRALPLLCKGDDFPLTDIPLA